MRGTAAHGRSGSPLEAKSPVRFRKPWRGSIRERAMVITGFVAAGASLAGMVLVPGHLGEVCAAIFAISTFLTVCANEAEQ